MSDDEYPSDAIAREVRNAISPPPPDTLPYVRETEVGDDGETIRCKTSWETGPYRVQYERGTGGVQIGTTTVNLKQLSAFIDVLEYAHASLLEFG